MSAVICAVVMRVYDTRRRFFSLLLFSFLFVYVYKCLRQAHAIMSIFVERCQTKHQQWFGKQAATATTDE